MGEVIKIKRFFDNSTVKESSESEYICRKNGSQNLYVRFSYFGKRICLTSGLLANRENEDKLGRFMARVIRDRDRGALNFAKAFPNAPEEMKATFSRMEGRPLCGEPMDVFFGTYARERYMPSLEESPSMTKKRDHIRRLESRVLPYFGDMAFSEINGVVLKRYINQLRHTRGKKKGEQLSGSMIRNILSAMRAVWYDACEENGWDIPDPFAYLARPSNRGLIPRKKPSKAPEVFRIDEFRKIITRMDIWYVPIVELMVMTGMIVSEMAGLIREDISETHIMVRRSLTRAGEGTLKNDFRQRDIPVTPAIRQRLEVLLKRTPRKRFVITRDFNPIDADGFRKNPWTRALKRAEIEYRVPYTLRHTFAAWQLTIGTHPEKLVGLMGHSSKKMIYEVYGRYVTGLEDDTTAIKEYFLSEN